MRHTPVNITSNTTTLIATLKNRVKEAMCEAMIYVGGTFGGVTITWFWSDDDGVNKYPITSSPGVPVSTNATDSFNVKLGVVESGASTPDLKLYATTTGGSGININVGVIDDEPVLG